MEVEAVIHHRTAIVLCVAAALFSTACGSNITTSGANSKEFFVLSEGYVWQYTSPDFTELFEVWYMGERTVDGEDVHVLSWKFDTAQALALDEVEADPALFFMDTYWSKNDEGILFWGAGAVDNANALPAWDEVFYADSLLFAGVDLYPGDSLSSSSNGESWTSEYVDSVDTVETFGGTFQSVMQVGFQDETQSSPFGGDWYLARNTGIIQFQVRGRPDEQWTLNKVTY